MFLRYHYPKLGLLVIVSVCAYLLFALSSFPSLITPFFSTSWLSFFLTGLLFSFGFTTPFAIGLFFVADPSSPFFMAFIGGCGAMVSDMLIFQFIRFSFIDEFGKLKKEKLMRLVEKPIRRVPSRFSHYLLYAFAGLIIASPLPDEVGVSLLAGLTHIRTVPLALISFACNVLGIYLLLLL